MRVTFARHVVGVVSLTLVAARYRRRCVHLACEGRRSRRWRRKSEQAICVPPGSRSTLATRRHHTRRPV